MANHYAMVAMQNKVANDKSENKIIELQRKLDETQHKTVDFIKLRHNFNRINEMVDKFMNDKTTEPEKQSLEYGTQLYYSFR
jgi:uncharacterized membrane protein